MKQKTNKGIIISFLMLMILMACNEQSKKDEPVKKDVSSNETGTLPPYDPAMDPIKVESEFNKVLADTLNIKLHEVTLQREILLVYTLIQTFRFTYFRVALLKFIPKRVNHRYWS